MGNAEVLESPQASAPTSFFPPWEKDIFTAIYEENSEALEKAVQDPNFDKTTTVRNYVYDGKLKLFLGDTLLDVAHRNKSSSEMKEILRHAGCEARNKVASENHDRIVQAEVKRRQVEDHGVDAYHKVNEVVPSLKNELSQTRSELRSKLELLNRCNFELEEHKAAIRRLREKVKKTEEEMARISTRIKRRESILIYMFFSLAAMVSLITVIFNFIKIQRQTHTAADMYQTLKI